MNSLQTPVLIGGGGGAGPTASMLLSQLGVELLLVSALPTTSILPKAHVLNQRAMEILTDVGVADAIYGHGAVLVRPDRFVAWRSYGESPDPRGAREAAFYQILAKER